MQTLTYEEIATKNNLPRNIKDLPECFMVAGEFTKDGREIRTIGVIGVGQFKLDAHILFEAVQLYQGYRVSDIDFYKVVIGLAVVYSQKAKIV